MKNKIFFLTIIALSAQLSFSLEHNPPRDEFLFELECGLWPKLRVEISEEQKSKNLKRIEKREKYKQFIEAIKDVKIEYVQQVLMNGINPNKTITPFAMPLYYAISNLSEPMLKLLLSNNANPNAYFDWIGRTPLSYLVVEFYKYPGSDAKKSTYLPIIKLLLYHGANPYTKEKFSESAFEIAKRQKIEDLVTLFSGAQENLIKKLYALLSRGQTPFPSEIALKIAHFRYKYSSKKEQI